MERRSTDLCLPPALIRHVIPDLPSAAELQPYLQRIDEARWYSNFGPLVCELEEKISALLASPSAGRSEYGVHVTTLASGYHALEIALRLSARRHARRVLVPAVTFCACPLAVQHAGLEPVLADVDPTTWMLTPEIARAALQRMELAAVMPVATYGVPQSCAGWDEFSKDTGVPVVLDAAAAFESQRVLRKGLVACSLHATKPFGVGEGAVLLGTDSDQIAQARRFSNFGMIGRVGHADGANTKMSEYHAAVGLAQLERWTAVKARRRAVLELYRRRLGPLAGLVSMQPSIDHAVVSILMLRLSEPIAAAVIDEGRRLGIGLHQTYFPPLYRHPNFARIPLVDIEGKVHMDGDIGDKAAHMPGSEELLKHLVGVPFHAFMREEDVEFVVQHFAELAENSHRVGFPVGGIAHAV
jgi:dTDP-4-amino-4,6-dideoxygalactose transaminase